MAKKYTSRNKIKFTSISERYQVEKSAKGKVSELHASLITYVVNHFKDTKKYKQQVVDVLNLMTYVVYSGDMLFADWRLSKPLENVPEIEDGIVESTLGDIFLTVDAIDWDVKPTDNIESDDVVGSTDSMSNMTNVAQQTHVTKNTQPVGRSTTKVVKKVTPKYISSPTPKQDLYIQSPVVPRFDYNKVWIQGKEGADDLVIYTTLPEIPTRQNEVSCTTDVTKMTSSELLNLYPNTVIRTRAPILYTPIPGLEYDEELGTILPIGDYTHDQLVRNIIEYPHFFKLTRSVGDKVYSFYTHIELEGQLVGILDVWESLPDTHKIPRQKEFVKEYVVRKYLLDKEYKKVKYTYPLEGSLEPFLTLFMPPENYIARGFPDVENLARQCVLSRVRYKQSRNPVIRRLDNV